MENIEQKVEAEGQSHVNAIANLNAENVYFGNKPDRHVLLDDWKPSFEHMQGRKDAINALDIALADPKKAIACIVGLGGYGKSTLAAKLFADWKGGRFWADLSQRSRDFREFATRAIAQLGQKSLEQMNNLPEVQLGYELAAVLQGQGFLVVLDNLESLLDGDGNWESVLWREFLQNWANDGEGSKVLVTTREEPNLPKLRFFRYELRDGLADAEGAAVLRDFGILGTEAELVAVSQRVGGIPLSLMLIVGLLCNDYEEEPHVRFLPEDLFGIEGAHRLGRVTTEAVFLASFERLEPRLQSLLIAMSVFAKPFDRTMAAAMIVDEEVTDRDLLLLKKRGFVLDESGCYRFQPQIQELVQRQAADLPELHRRAINFYLTLCEAKPTLDPRHDTLEDADPYLQVFHHYCELGEYERAFYVLRSGTNKIDAFLSLCGYSAKRVALYTRLVNRWQLEQTQQWKYTASLTSLGSAYYSLGQYQQAIVFYNQSLEIYHAIGDKEGELVCLCNLGLAYENLGNLQHSKYLYQKSLEIQQEISDTSNEVNHLYNLALTHHRMGNYKQAINFYHSSLEIQRINVWDKQDMANCLGNLGLAYKLLGQFQQAINFYQRSLEISLEIGDKGGRATCLRNLGLAYFCIGDYKQALELHRQSLAIQQEIDNKHNEAVCLGDLGDTYDALGNYQQAIKFHNQSLEIQRTINDKFGEIDSLFALSKAYPQIGGFKEGFAASFRASQLLKELKLSKEDMPYRDWVKSINLFAQQGKWQNILCACIGLFVLPLFFACIIVYQLWRFLRSLIKR